MKRSSTIFLQIVIALIGLVVLAALIGIPPLEGRAADLDLIHIYADPLILYTYAGSIAFFAALYQGFKLLGYVDQNKVFSPSAVKAVRNIKYCALALSGFVVLGILYIRLTVVNDDDPAGVTALSFFIIFGSIVIATAAAVFERLLQNAVDIKSENELTV